MITNDNLGIAEEQSVGFVIASWSDSYHFHIYGILYILSVFCIRLISSNCPESNSHENNQQQKKTSTKFTTELQLSKNKNPGGLEHIGDYTTQLGIITSCYQDPHSSISKLIGSRCGIFTYIWLIFNGFHVGRYTSTMDASWVFWNVMSGFIQRFTLLNRFLGSGHDLLQWAQAHFRQCPFGLAS